MKLPLLVLSLAVAAGCKVEGASSPAADNPAPPPVARSHRATPAPSLPPSASPDDGGQARRDRRAERMKQWDKDGDGVLSDEEREAMRAARREERMKRLDTNGDGVVSDEERAAAMAERAASTFSRLDADGDGVLTPDELAGARWFRGDPAKADADGDGKISVEELQKAMENGRGWGRRNRGE